MSLSRSGSSQSLSGSGSSQSLSDSAGATSLSDSFLTDVDYGPLDLPNQEEVSDKWSLSSSSGTASTEADDESAIMADEVPYISLSGSTGSASTDVDDESAIMADEVPYISLSGSTGSASTEVEDERPIIPDEIADAAIRTKVDQLTRQASDLYDKQKYEDSITVYEAALLVLQGILEANRTVSDLHELDALYSNLSLAYSQIGAREKAIEANKKAYEALTAIPLDADVSDENKLYYLGIYATAIARQYDKLKRPELKAKYVEIAFEHWTELESMRVLTDVELTRVAECHFLRKDYQLAVLALEQVKNKEAEHHQAMARYKLELAGKVDSTEQFSEKSVEALQLLIDALEESYQSTNEKLKGWIKRDLGVTMADLTEFVRGRNPKLPMEPVFIPSDFDEDKTSEVDVTLTSPDSIRMADNAFRQLAEEAFQRGEALFVRGDFSEAITQYDVAISTLRCLIERYTEADRRSFDHFYNNIASASRKLNDYQQMLIAYVDAQTVLIPIAKADSFEDIYWLAYYAQGISICHYHYHNAEQALAHIDEAIDTLINFEAVNTLKPEGILLLAQCYKQKGDYLREQGNYALAIKRLETLINLKGPVEIESKLKDACYRLMARTLMRLARAIDPDTAPVTTNTTDSGQLLGRAVQAMWKIKERTPNDDSLMQEIDADTKNTWQSVDAYIAKKEASTEKTVATSAFSTFAKPQATVFPPIDLKWEPVEVVKREPTTPRR